MKKYSTPVVEKIIFDYTVQTAGSGCIKQITNTATADNVCGLGTPDETWIRNSDPNW